MKVLFILTSSVFFSTCITAQVTSPNLKKSLPKVAAADLATTIVQPKAKLIGQSALGKVYAMPADNMPCLVPPAGIENSITDFVFPLPKADMPNPIPKQDFFTSPSANANLFKFNKPKKEVSKNLMLDLVRKK